MSEHDYELLEAWVQFYEDYYKEAIAEIAQKPNDKQSLWIDQSDLFSYNPGLLDDLLAQPDEVLSNAEEAVDMVDVPLDVTNADRRRLPEVVLQPDKSSAVVLQLVLGGVDRIALHVDL